jgi:hypothetical protein
MIIARIRQTGEDIYVATTTIIAPALLEYEIEPKPEPRKGYTIRRAHEASFFISQDEVDALIVLSMTERAKQGKPHIMDLTIGNDVVARYIDPTTGADVTAAALNIMEDKHE